MSQVKELLVECLQDLLHAETQLTSALPKMAGAAHHPKLREGFEKHLAQTETHVERLRRVFEILGARAQPRPCKAMLGLIEEGEETIRRGADKDPIVADLALIGAAQKVEHYEIASYGTARSLALQIGERSAARLLTHTLGDEESTDFLLTVISEPLLQQAALDDMGADVNLEAVNLEAVPAAASRSSKANGRTL